MVSRIELINQFSQILLAKVLIEIQMSRFQSESLLSTVVNINYGHQRKVTKDEMYSYPTTVGYEKTFATLKLTLD